MRFALLGPLTITDGAGAGEHAGPAGPRQRILLAALLLHANMPVSTEALAETVWDGSPPPAAITTLRSYVRRLRRALGAEGRTRIAARYPGYLICLQEPELDVLEFEALCKGTGAALRNGQWASASAEAARALRLWRATPLLDVPSQMLADAFVPGLEQLRLQALEDGFEARLRLGEHQNVISELRELAAQHPLRERFHAQLMLALAGTGRQAEALEAYLQARHALVNKLGIEPGAELRDLHQRILAGDIPAVMAQLRLSDQARDAAPRQLPAAVGHFTGRRKELERLVGVLGEAGTGTVVISAIDGMAGIGKTALAVQAAHRVSALFPGGQLFIDLHGYAQGHQPRTPGDALDWLLRALSVPAQRIPRDVEGRAALYRQRLAGTRTLIVLDNAASEAQVRPLFPGGAGCVVLVTSRRRLIGLDDAHLLPLEVLPQADAEALVRAVAGPGRVGADDPVLAEIAGLCGQLPLALRIAAALLRHRPGWTLGHLAGLLRDQRQRLSVLSDGERDLDAAFSLSYRSLPGAQQRLFRCLGLVPGPDVDGFAAAALADTDSATATQLLEDLADHSLLTLQASGRYRLHDLIRLHATALAAHDRADDRDTALGRLLDFYQHTARRADALITRSPRPAPGGPAPAHAPALPDRDSARAWLRAERANLLAAVQHATDHGHHRRLIALAAGLDTLLRADGPWAQAVILHTAAAAAARSLGDRLGQADALTRLGPVRGVAGDNPGAIRALEEALQVYQDLGKHLGQANALSSLGQVRRVISDYPGALRDLKQALRLYQDLDDRLGQAYTLTQLGEVRRVTGDYPGALRDLEQALRLAQDQRYQVGQANALTRLGQLRQATGNYPGALRDLEQALRLYQDLDDRLGQGNVLIRLGQARLSAGDGSAAVHHLKAAVDLFRHIGIRNNAAEALNHYAAAVAVTGDQARARDLYYDALHLARDTQQLDNEAIALEGIGECCLHSGQAADGIGYLKQALDIFQRLAATPDADRVQARLGEMSQQASRSAHDPSRNVSK
jgi:DNA-binding SARP family transcriptional activator/tetratricopeptide (TPR) repeat protein